MTSSRTKRILAVGSAVLMAGSGLAAAPAAASHAPSTSCASGRDLVYDGYSWLGSVFRYRIDRASFPSRFDTVRKRDRVVARIRYGGMRAWNQGRTDCHFPRHTGFQTAYDTTSPAGDPTNHSNGVNTIAFVAGLTCAGQEVYGCTNVRTSELETVNTKAGRMEKAVEADIRLDRDDRWHARIGRRSCDPPAYDIWNATAHEVGHVVGVDDLYNNEGGVDNSWQTMYWADSGSDYACSFRQRELGRSDWIGLTRLYTTP